MGSSILFSVTVWFKSPFITKFEETVSAPIFHILRVTFDVVHCLIFQVQL